MLWWGWILVVIMALLFLFLEYLAFSGWRFLKEKKHKKADVLYIIHLIPILIGILFVAFYGSSVSSIMKKLHEPHSFLFIFGTIIFVLAWMLPELIISKLRDDSQIDLHVKITHS